MVAVAGVPGDSTTFYFGAVNGGIWKTSDAGTVWKPIFDNQPVGSIGAIAVAPSDPKIIYAGTGESDIRSDLSSGNGVYKSMDAGSTWTHVGLEDTRQISRIAIDPRDPNVVYVGVLGHAYGPNEQRGVYKSVDGGTHWAKVLDERSEIGISDVAICSGNPQLLFAGTWNTHRPPWSTYAPIDGPGGGLYRSKDAGKTWSRLNNGLPEGDWGRIGVDVAPDGKRVYALIQAKKSGLYRSDDGGETWTLENADPRLTSRAWYFNSITIDPQNADVTYIPNVALYRSEDGGKTISIVRGAPGGDDYHQIWVDPKNSDSMVLGTDQGTTVSLDRGQTWSTWYNQPTAQLYHVITDNQFPYIVYGAQQDSGSAAVPSRTDHGQITPRDWFPAGGSESGYMAPDPKDPNIIYLSGTYGSVSRYNRRTGLSQDVTPWPVPTFGSEINQRKYRDPWTPVLIFSPADSTTLYLGTQYVMKTLDGGLHWQTISPDLTGSTQQPGDKAEGATTTENAKQRGYGVVFTIAASALNRDTIWAGSDTGLIHLTRDGGKTWKDVTPAGLTVWSKISFIEASHFDPAVAYAAVDRSRLDDQTPYLYRTRDYGATWQLITNGIAANAFLRGIREDTERKGLLFAGTELGVYVSFDDGGELAVFATQSAGDFRPRSHDSRRRSGSGYARPLILDSGRHHAASTGARYRKGQCILALPSGASISRLITTPSRALRFHQRNQRPRTRLQAPSLTISSSLPPALSRWRFSMRNRSSSTDSLRKTSIRRSARRFPSPSVGSPSLKSSKLILGCIALSGILVGAAREDRAWMKKPNSAIPGGLKWCRGSTQSNSRLTERRRLSLWKSSWTPVRRPLPRYFTSSCNSANKYLPKPGKHSARLLRSPRYGNNLPICSRRSARKIRL